MKFQVFVSVVGEQWSQAGVGQSLDPLLLFEIRHLLPRRFQVGRLQRYSPSRPFTENTSLHVEFLSSAPQSSYFSIAGVFDDGKAIPVFYGMFGFDDRNRAFGFTCGFKGLHKAKVEHRQETSEKQADLPG
jgi:hypothetical protein